MASHCTAQPARAKKKRVKAIPRLHPLDQDNGLIRPSPALLPRRLVLPLPVDLLEQEQHVLIVNLPVAVQIGQSRQGPGL